MTVDPIDPMLSYEESYPEDGSAATTSEAADVPAAEDDDDPGEDEKPPKKKMATVIVEMAERHYALGLSTDGLAFGIQRNGPNLARPLRGGRLGLRAALADMYMRGTGSAASSGALADALLVIEGRCTHADPVQLYHRVAPHEDGIVVDLGTPDGRAVVIDPTGWKVVNRSPVTFRRSELTLPLPEPERTGEDLLVEPMGNISPASWPLVVGWLVAALFYEVPHPVLLLRGEQGTAKTTMARCLGSVIDRNGAPVRSAPRDKEEWATAASGSWTVALDNLSTISEWLSDSLCRAVTGDGAVRRKLYTDDDVSVLSFKRVIIITTIDAGALRGDLADRLLAVELDRIAPGRRRTEEDVAEHFRQRHPALLGSLFDAAADVLAEMPSIKLTELPRMADFAKVLAALDRVRPCDGETRLSRYLDLGAVLAQDVIEGDPFASAVRDLARAQFTWRGTATQLLGALATPDQRPKTWPRTPQALGGALSRAAPPLRAVGVEVDRDRTHGSDSKRMITLRSVTDGPQGEESRK